MNLQLGMACSLAVLGLAVGVGVGFSDEDAQHRARLEAVLADLTDIQVAIGSYGVDRCGNYHPPDTSLRVAAGEDVSLTFEWDLAHFTSLAKQAGSWDASINWQPIADPIPYMAEVPQDRYSPGEPYGFATLSWGNKQANVGVLRSVGPNGQPDLDLRQLRERMVEHFGQRRDIDGADLEWLFSEIAPYQWDQATGFTSSGDIIVILVSNSPVLVRDTTGPLKEYLAGTLHETASPSASSTEDANSRGQRRSPEIDSMMTSTAIARDLADITRYRLDYGWLMNSFPVELMPFFDQPFPLNEEQVELLNQRLSRHAGTMMIWSSLRDYPITKGTPMKRDVYFEFMPVIGKSMILLAAADAADSRTDHALRRLDYLDRLLTIGKESHADYTHHEQWVFSELRRISKATREMIVKQERAGD